MRPFYKNGGIEHIPFDKETKMQTAKMPRKSSLNETSKDHLGKEENGSPQICGLKVIRLTGSAWKSARKGIKSKSSINISIVI